MVVTFLLNVKCGFKRFYNCFVIIVRNEGVAKPARTAGTCLWHVKVIFLIVNETS